MLMLKSRFFSRDVLHDLLSRIMELPLLSFFSYVTVAAKVLDSASLLRLNLLASFTEHLAL